MISTNIYIFHIMKDIIEHFTIGNLQPHDVFKKVFNCILLRLRQLSHIDHVVIVCLRNTVHYRQLQSTATLLSTATSDYQTCIVCMY